MLLFQEKISEKMETFRENIFLDFTFSLEAAETKQKEEIFYNENRKKCRHIITDDNRVPFNLLFILCPRPPPTHPSWKLLPSVAHQLTKLREYLVPHQSNHSSSCIHS